MNSKLCAIMLVIISGVLAANGLLKDDRPSELRGTAFVLVDHDNQEIARLTTHEGSVTIKATGENESGPRLEYNAKSGVLTLIRDSSFARVNGSTLELYSVPSEDGVINGRLVLAPSTIEFSGQRKSGPLETFYILLSSLDSTGQITLQLHDHQLQVRPISRNIVPFSLK